MSNIPMRYNPAQDYPASNFEVARQRLSESGYRVGATRIYKVPGLTAAISAGTVTSPLPVRWRANGICISMYGQVASAVDADAAQTEAQVQISGQEELFTDGNAGVSVPFFALFGPTQNWFSLNRYVYVGQDWNTIFKNTSIATNILPSLFFAVVEEDQTPIKRR